MYVPRHFEELDVQVLHALVESHPLGTWVIQVDDRLVVNHIPFILDRTAGAFGTLRGHVARANEAWKRTSDRVESVVVFQGPQAYITPSWYAAKHEHGKVVPTWNYAVVHAHGMPRIVEDTEWLRRNVEELTRTHEAGRSEPWQVADAPPEYVEGLLGAIVGVEIPIARLVGKWKVSQNRSELDRRGVIDGLQASGFDEQREMAHLVQRERPKA